MAVAVYCRVSSEDQAERGTIEIQKDFAAKYVNLYNLDVFDYYCDDGVTGTLPLEMRPEGKRLLEDAANHKFNTVIFHKLDRLGRKVRVILNAVHDLDEFGVSIKSMTEPFETETPTGKFLLTTLAGIAELDRDTILARMWSGAQLAAKQGRWLGGVVPYGYQIVGKRLVISDEPIPGFRISEEDVIEIIYRMAGKEKASCPEIADYLNSLKIPTKYQVDKLNNNSTTASAMLWHPSRIAHIIRSTTYKGVHQYGKKTTHKGSKLITRSVPAIVSEELWEKANNVLTSNRLFSRRNSQIEYLLRGMIRCGNCGYAYVGRPNKRDNTKFYICVGKSKWNYKYYQKERCIGKSLHADWLDDIVWEKCLEFLKNPEMIYKEKTPLHDDSQPVSNVSYELQQIKIRLKGMSGEREKLLDLYRKEIITEADLKKQIDKLYKEETNLNKKLSTLNDNLPKQELKRSKDSVVALLQDFAKTIQNVDVKELPFELKRSVVKMLIDKVIIYTEKAPDKSYPEVKIDINWRFDAPPFKIDYIENYTVNREICNINNNNVRGVRIRTARLKKGYSLRQLSKASNISQVCLTRIELGNTSSNVKILAKLAKVLNLPLVYVGAFDTMPVNTLQQRLEKSILSHGHWILEAVAAIGIDQRTYRSFMKGCNVKNRSLIKIKNYIAETEKAGE